MGLYMGIFSTEEKWGVAGTTIVLEGMAHCFTTIADSLHWLLIEKTTLGYNRSLVELFKM